MKPKRTGGTRRRTNLLPMCRPHHKWIHDHEGQAAMMGLLELYQIPERGTLARVAWDMGVRYVGSKYR